MEIQQTYKSGSAGEQHDDDVDKDIKDTAGNNFGDFFDNAKLPNDRVNILCESADNLVSNKESMQHDSVKKTATEEHDDVSISENDIRNTNEDTIKTVLTAATSVNTSKTSNGKDNDYNEKLQETNTNIQSKLETAYERKELGIKAANDDKSNDDVSDQGECSKEEYLAILSPGVHTLNDSTGRENIQDIEGYKTQDIEGNKTHDKVVDKTQDMEGDKTQDKEGDKTQDIEREKTPDKEEDKTPDIEKDETHDKDREKNKKIEEDKTQDTEGDKTNNREGDKTHDKERDKTEDIERDETHDKEGDKTQEMEGDKTQDIEEDKANDKEGDKTDDTEEGETHDKEGDIPQDKEEEQTQDIEGKGQAESSLESNIVEENGRHAASEAQLVPRQSHDFNLDHSQEPVTHIPDEQVSHERENTSIFIDRDNKNGSEEQTEHFQAKVDRKTTLNTTRDTHGDVSSSSESHGSLHDTTEATDTDNHDYQAQTPKVNFQDANKIDDISKYEKYAESEISPPLINIKPVSPSNEKTLIDMNTELDHTEIVKNEDNEENISLIDKTDEENVQESITVTNQQAYVADKDVRQNENLKVSIQQHKQTLYDNEIQSSLPQNNAELELGEASSSSPLNLQINITKDNQTNECPVIKHSSDNIKSHEIVEYDNPNNTKDQFQTSNPIDSTEAQMGENQIQSTEQSQNIYFTGRLPTLEPYEAAVIPKEDFDDSERDMADQGPTNASPLPFQSQSLSQNDNFDKHDDDNIKQDPRNISLNDKEQKADIPEIELDKSVKEVETGTRVSTPSREIKRLIQEINAPAQIFRLSKEKPLTPGENNQVETQNQSKPEKPISETSVREDLAELEGNNLTVGDLNKITSEIMTNDYAKQSAAKYDDLPHMKKISEYTAEANKSLKSNQDKQRKEKNSSEHIFTRTVTEITDQTSENKADTQLDDTTSASYEIEQTALANQQGELTENDTAAVKTSHSETDLKEMIASAKRAIEDGTSAKKTATNTSSDNTWRTDESTYGTNFDALICSNCLCVNSDVATSGFCHECQEYLCGNCKRLHKQTSATMYHKVMQSYCTNELKVRKYVRATAYCQDCQVFLCMKCTVQHTGFRAFRHHKIYQSSFISKQTQSLNSSSLTLDTTRETEKSNENKHLKVKENKKGNSRKTFRKDLQENNHYRFRFAKVPESVYPGPDKKLAISYTSNPHWPFSSIPTLPYLVTPGNLRQRSLKTPYLQNYRTPFYTKTKKDFEPNAIKMKALQSRYNAEPAKRHLRRREAELFTARPLRNHDGVSLPNISSPKKHHRDEIYTDHVKTAPANTARRPLPANKLKTAVYVCDQCLSIPFPSNELPCQISGMEVLSDGRHVVLDKKNNSIKLFSRKFHFTAKYQFNNRVVDICSSSIYPTDIYVATPRHLYEISTKKGMEIVRKMKVEIARIEGLACWKYGLAIIALKTSLSWEIRLLDFRGNLKSKLEILNPFQCDIASSSRYHMVPSKGGKYLTISDTSNALVVKVDVISRCVVSETFMAEHMKPSYLTTDYQNNIYVSCGDQVQQVSAKGRNLGVVLKLGDEAGRLGCIAYNTTNDCLYVQLITKTQSDIIAIYKMSI